MLRVYLIPSPIKIDIESKYAKKCILTVSHETVDTGLFFIFEKNYP